MTKAWSEWRRGNLDAAVVSLMKFEASKQYSDLSTCLQVNRVMAWVRLIRGCWTKTTFLRQSRTHRERGNVLIFANCMNCARNGSCLSHFTTQPKPPKWKPSV